MVQILWSIFQIIIRAFRHLTISLLELAVLAFALCAIIIYALHWKKPKFVQTTVTILEYKDQIPPDVLGLLGHNSNLENGGIMRSLFLTEYQEDKWFARS
ncbi:hypothetical protein B0T25DRAFT_187259 [Lasiosphaeria hispida]|uniref:Uncharacterized protein n=1 Tax=Lasiosphaeria hispida TaxID=260671 RepID=A0AAJ0HHK0_9PEZI|nr:hypothetical protein B0T25DRAFT_187259 [Lasiosphaeria hispida]